MIQQNINQLLGMAAVVAKMDPGSEQRAELHKVNKALAGYKQQTEFWDKKTTETDEESPIKDKLVEDIVQASKEKFELQPSAENFAKYTQNINAAGEFKAIRTKYDKAMAERAAKEDIRKQELAKVRESLLANAPNPKWGVRKNGDN